jgi:hypothetical protein
MSSSSSKITNEKIARFELGPYWEEHRETLDKLSNIVLLISPTTERIFLE